MENKRRLSRLGAKLAGVSMLGLVLAFAVFYAVDSIFLPWLFYDSRFTSFWSARADAAAAEYQDYVSAHSFTVQQALEWQEASAQAPEAEAITLVFKALPLDVDISAAASYTWSEAENVDEFFVSGALDLRQIQCADGILYLSDAANTAQVRNSVRAAGLALALLSFCGVMIPCIIRLVRRIGALSRETGILMAGDLDHAIHMKGRDELSGLGEDIERLRQSVAARLAGERQAVGANSQLITSLSHDLRTPLTKLTGYLDILAYGKYQTQAEHDEFLRLASEKAAQIKSLTDQLFSSAQVKPPEGGLEEPPEEVDGAALLSQLLAEQCDDLNREGFIAQPPVFHREFPLYLRAADAVRIFDNLFSNLKKYADPSFPIALQAEDEPQTITLRIQNHVLSAPDRTDSHGLGVPTMKTLLSGFGGALDVSLSNGVYTSVLTLPKRRNRSV